MDKENVVNIYTMKYYSAIKRNGILLSVTTYVDLEGIISQKEKDKPHLISLICGI